MDALITKWGNSLGIRIPSGIAKKAKLHAGSRLHFETTRTGEIMLRVTNEEETLDKLYEKITPENSHAALFTSPIGNEHVEWKQ